MGPTRGKSIPHITFIELNAVASQKTSKLLLKRHPFVMLVLASNVLPHVVHAGLAHGERALSVLPVEPLEGRPFRFQPDGGTAFERSHHITQGVSPRAHEQRMGVVGLGVDLQQGRIEIAEDATHIGMQVRANGIVQERLSVPGREDQMDIDFSKRLRHEGRSSLRHPFRVRMTKGGEEVELGTPRPRVSPWAPSRRPVGPERRARPRDCNVDEMTPRNHTTRPPETGRLFRQRSNALERKRSDSWSRRSRNWSGPS
jgi:hypothetical protein